MDKLKKLLNRETILYIIFGVATTAVNYVVFHLLYNVLWRQNHSLAANAAAFVAAVIFAYVVNKLFVFESRSWDAATLKREIVLDFPRSMRPLARRESPAFQEYFAAIWKELQQ